ncbi:1133_t:CDS:2 [Acaulospora morrowiae]|uniref:1133_t:CDS:1 n=1 Tax=Acaulospora morrowiae TaxID=94023 RepID=A0A9N8YR55_9GLOM|nr:1133_t:CDS:2 [Acaulospora morrowiae]
MASIVDESYSSRQDVYDALLNTLFPITFVILFNISRYKSEEPRKNEQPISNEKSKEDEESISSKNSKENNGSGKNGIPRDKFLSKVNLLPILDDLLYNAVTWYLH